MINDRDYKVLHFTEMAGSGGTFGIRILVAGDNLPDLDQDSIRRAAYDAAERVTAEVLAAKIAEDPAAKARTEKERKELLSLFPEPIFAEPIPNGYCSRYCCRHLPWYRVTTKIGVFEVGWRKRVIEIDWSRTVVETKAEKLFPGESVTKQDRLIHAWSVEDARRYVRTVLEAAEAPEKGKGSPVGT